MKISKLSVLVTSILLSGAIGCQAPPNRIRNSGTLNAKGSISKASPKPTTAVDALTQLKPDDTVVLELAYLGYNESPATVSNVVLATSLSTSTTTGLSGSALPAQKELFEGYSEKVQEYYSGLKGVKFTMRFSWKDIQADLTQIKSDSTQPIYFNWEYTPAGGKTSSLYSINLSDRLRSALTSSASVLQLSVAQANGRISGFTQNRDAQQQVAANATAKLMHTLAIDDDLADEYPFVTIESSGVSSFTYTGLSVKVESASK